METGNTDQHSGTVTLMDAWCISEFSLWDKFDQQCNNWPTRWKTIKPLACRYIAAHVLLTLQTPECSALVHQCWQDVHWSVYLLQNNNKKKGTCFFFFCFVLFIQMSVLNVCNVTWCIYSVKLCWFSVEANLVCVHLFKGSLLFLDGVFCLFVLSKNIIVGQRSCSFLPAM